MTSVEDVAQWWGTSVSRMEPGVVELRGRPVQDLIGSASLPAVIWLLVRGSLPAPGEAALLEAALVASVDHGPQAPSIAAARMAATCGVGLNTAVATGAGMLGDSHGGAGEQAVQMFSEIRDAERGGGDLTAVTARVLAAWRARSRYIPGFGHRFHPVDPRRAPLLSLVDERGAGRGGGRRLPARRPRGGGGAEPGTGPAGPDEHRRCHRGHLRRARLRTRRSRAGCSC